MLAVEGYWNGINRMPIVGNVILYTYACHCQHAIDKKLLVGFQLNVTVQDAAN